MIDLDLNSNLQSLVVALAAAGGSWYVAKQSSLRRDKADISRDQNRDVRDELMNLYREVKAEAEECARQHAACEHKLAALEDRIVIVEQIQRRRVLKKT